MDDLQAFQSDIDLLVNTLKEIFESEEVRYVVDADSDRLFVEIKGLEEYSDEEIEEMAGEVLEELDLDFDEIALLPLI